MHTSTFRTARYGAVTVQHNGDWSGDALVQWREEGEGAPTFEARLPAALLSQLGAPVAHRQLVGDLLGWLEQHTLLGSDIADAAATAEPAPHVLPVCSLEDLSDALSDYSSRHREGWDVADIVSVVAQWLQAGRLSVWTVVRPTAEQARVHRWWWLRDSEAPARSCELTVSNLGRIYVSEPGRDGARSIDDIPETAAWTRCLAPGA